MSAVTSANGHQDMQQYLNSDAEADEPDVIALPVQESDAQGHDQRSQDEECAGRGQARVC